MGEPAGGGTLKTNLEEHMLRGREVIAPRDYITKFLPEDAFPVQTTKLSGQQHIFVLGTFVLKYLQNLPFLKSKTLTIS